jgi:hypothetical protein
VKAHFFLCMLAYYVRWHKERAWASLTFKDDDTSHKRDRDPVTPAKRSQAATDTAQTGTLPDGTPAHTHESLLSDLVTITRNTCSHDDTGVTFPMTTRPMPQQQRALNLLDTITL